MQCIAGGYEMRVILKFVLRNMKEKKFRTFLIVFAIMISSALFFASSAIGGTVASMYLNRISKYYGSAEIMIYSGAKSPSSFLTASALGSYMNEIEYVVYMTSGGGVYRRVRGQNVQFNIYGVNYEDLQIMNPITLIKQENLLPFTGKKIILSKNAAGKYGLKAGDTIKVEIEGVYYTFDIVGIAYPQGLLMEDGQSINVIIPREMLNSVYGVQNQATTLYIKTKAGVAKQKFLSDLSSAYKRYYVRETISGRDIKQRTGDITTPYMLMVAIVLFMSSFIIFTTFRVIATERMPIIGTFRSIGATRMTTDLVLLGECLIYGIIGGLLGCFLGIGILYGMSMTTISPWERELGLKGTIQFTPLHMVAAFFVAVILSLSSSAIPIIKVARIPVKEIVLNIREESKKKKKWKAMLGITFLVVSLSAPSIVPDAAALPVDFACLLLSGAAVIILVPYITTGFIKILERFYLCIFGNEGVIAVRNLRENRNILNNISLLSIGISALLMINTVSGSVMTEVTNTYRNITYDAEIWGPQSGRNTELMLRRIDGIAETYGVYRMRRIEIADTKESIEAIDSVDKYRHNRFYNFEFGQDTEKLFLELDEGRNIIITNRLREKLKARKGDSIVLKTRVGDKKYKVIGFFDTLMWNGSYGLISERYLKTDGAMRYYSFIGIRTNKNPDETVNAINKELGYKGIEGITLAEEKKLDDENNRQLFNVLQGFSIITLVIGIFGILNNFTISFLERKRVIAMMSAVGMSRGQTLKVIFVEALTGGLIGGAMGVLTGVLMISIVPYVMKAINISVPIHYSKPILIIAVAAGVTISLIASVGPALKSSQMNIIEAIKYE
jgi:putative ABC transport system permease protein